LICLTFTHLKRKKRNEYLNIVFPKLGSNSKFQLLFTITALTTTDCFIIPARDFHGTK
jgi:hypothetical protein